MASIDGYQGAASRVGDEGASPVAITGEPGFIENGALSDAARQPNDRASDDEPLQHDP